MVLEEKIQKQRVKHIVSSYQLEGDEEAQCAHYLDELLRAYPSALIELALVEAIAQNWATLPMPRGVAFFEQVQHLLKSWETEEISVMLDPEQFQQITGLDPTPVFNSSGFQPPSVMQPH